MTSSIFTKKYSIFCHLLIESRKQNGLTQQKLAEILNKPQSFVSKYESGERRLDVIEFLEVADALNINKPEFIEELELRSSK